MAKNRREHRKACRLNGERRKIERAAHRQHMRDLATLQKVMEHADKLRAERPELFLAVMDTVDKLADAKGVVTRALTNVEDPLVFAAPSDAEQALKTPSNILREIADARARISAAMTKAPVAEPAL